MVSSFQPVPDVLELDMNYTLLGQRMQNSLYFYSLAGISFPSDYEDLDAFVYDTWFDVMKPFQPDDLTLDNITITDLSEQTAPSLVFTHGSQGTSISPPVNTGTTFTTTFRTRKRGRSFRGRNYFVGLVESQISGNTIQSGVLDATLNFYNTILNNVGTIGTSFAWVIVQRYSNGVLLLEGVPEPVYSVDHVDHYADYQRRRGSGRGS